MKISLKNYIAEIIISMPLFFELSELEKKEPLKPFTEVLEVVQVVPPINELKPKEIPSKTFEATFYTAFCPTGCIGITKSGYDVSNTIYYEGMRIIAAPKEIPLYTVFNVTLEDGEQFKAIVLDRGGDIKGNRIDILVKNREYAYKKGRQIAKLEEIK